MKKEILLALVGFLVVVSMKNVNAAYQFTKTIDVSEGLSSSGSTTGAMGMDTNMSSSSQECCFFIMDDGNDKIMLYNKTGSHKGNVSGNVLNNNPKGVFTNATGAAPTHFWITKANTRRLNITNSTGDYDRDTLFGVKSTVWSAPYSVWINKTDSSGIAYVVDDDGTCSIYSAHPNGTLKDTPITTESYVSSFCGLTSNCSSQKIDMFLMTDITTDKVYIMNSTGQSQQNISMSGNGVGSPKGIAIYKTTGAISDIFVIDSEDKSIYQYINYNDKPKWYSNSSTLPSSYNLNTKSYFNITWNSSTDNVDVVLIESNYSGSATNYTASNVGGSNYGYSIILPSGGFYWKSYSNNSNNEWNETDTWTFTLNTATPSILLFEVNDTYIDINGTVKLTVNASENANITAQIQTSDMTKNITGFTFSSNNYTKNIDKSILGDSQANATKINITHIFTDGSNYTMTTNTTTLNFTYAMADLSVSNSPTETITPGTVMNIYADYNTTEGNDIADNCSFTIGVSSYDMAYSSTNGRHECSVSTSGWTSTTYTYSVTCVNNSYQMKTGSGIFSVQAGEAGGDGGGGGGGMIIYAHLGEYCSEDMPCATGLICQDNICISETISLKTVCGNNICEEGENFLNCPEDCPTQSVWAAKAMFLIIGLSIVYVLFIGPRIEKKKKRKSRRY